MNPLPASVLESGEVSGIVDPEAIFADPDFTFRPTPQLMAALILEGAKNIQ